MRARGIRPGTRKKLMRISEDIPFGLRKGVLVLPAASYKTKHGPQIVVRVLKEGAPSTASYWDPRWSSSTTVEPKYLESC